MNSLFILLSPILKPTAYLDPGTGSMLIQLILAAALGIGVAVKIFWKKIKSWFTKNKSGENLELDPTAIVGEETQQNSPEDFTHS